MCVSMTCDSLPRPRTGSLTPSHPGFVAAQYGRNVGLSVAAVQKFAKQMLVSLKHMRNCGVLHADIKLDNILVNDKHNMIKLCDFGSAMFAGQNEITPYLVSRFYRPPEVRRSPQLSQNAMPNSRFGVGSQGLLSLGHPRRSQGRSALFRNAR